MQIAINFILFQVGWLACVMSVARQMEWLAMISIGAAISIHLLLVKDRRPEIQLILVAGMIGLLLDSTLISLGVFVPTNNLNYPGLAPLWLVGLWMLFSITINHSLRWLHRRYILASLTGFIFAPVAYIAGQKLGALHFPQDQSTLISLMIIGACWLVVTPLLLLSSRYFCSRNFHRRLTC